MNSALMWHLDVTGPIVPCQLTETQDFQKYINVIKHLNVTKVINSLSVMYMRTRRKFSLHRCIELKFSEVLFQY